MGRQQELIRVAVVPFGTSNHLEAVHLTLKREATRFRAYGTRTILPPLTSTLNHGRDEPLIRAASRPHRLSARPTA